MLATVLFELSVCVLSVSLCMFEKSSDSKPFLAAGLVILINYSLTFVACWLRFSFLYKFLSVR